MSIASPHALAKTTATMMFGVGESEEHRVDHSSTCTGSRKRPALHRVYPMDLPAQAHRSRWPWLARDHRRRVPQDARHLTFLSNFSQRADELGHAGTEGLPDRLALWRLIDVGSVMLEENVVKAAGTSNCTTKRSCAASSADAGFRPVQRDTLYRTYFLN